MTLRGMAALGAAMLSVSATAAHGATIVATGAGTATTSAAIGFQAGTAVQFTLARQTLITGIEIFGNVLTGGRISFNLSLSSSDVAPNPINVIYYREGMAGSTGGQGAWVGLTGLTDILLEAGTYWTQSGSDGVLSVAHYGASPNPLGNEALYLPTGGYQEADNLNLSWRISGTEMVGDPAPAIPEPVTWAMMIVGFAAMAFQLRQRRVTSPA